VALSETSSGWGVLCPFGNPSRLRDIQDGEAARVAGATEQIYVGTPRCLPSLVDVRDVGALKTRLTPMQGCRFAYTLHTNRALKDAIGLFKENEILDETCVIPGLDRVSAEGDDGGAKAISPYAPSRLLYTPLDNPVFVPTVALFIGDIVVSFAQGFVESVVEEMQKVRLHEYGFDVPDDQHVAVVQKLVTFGIHNGRNFVRPPHHGALEERDGNFVHDTSLAFSGVVPHVLFAFVLQVELIVRIPLSKSSQQMFGHPGSVDRPIVLGWLAYVPFDGATYQQGEIVLPLLTGPGKSPFDNALIFTPPPFAASAGPLATVSFNLHVPDFRPEEEAADQRQLHTASPRTALENPRRGSSSRDSTVILPPLDVPPSVPDAVEFSPSVTTQPDCSSVPSNVSSKLHSKTKEVTAPQFTELLAEDGKPPEEIKAEAKPLPEPENDRLKGNEIHVMFVGTTIPARTLFFTFQFWRYPMVTTRKVAIRDPTTDAAAAGIRLLYQADEEGAPTDSGLAVRFGGSGAHFVRYLERKCLQIDVWDGDTLMHIGDVVFELKHLLRAGRSGVQLTDYFEVVQHERTVLAKADSQSQVVTRPRVRGWLFLRLANIGCTVERVMSLALESSPIVSSARASQFSTVEVVDASKMADKYVELRQQLLQMRGERLPLTVQRGGDGGGGNDGLVAEEARRRKMAKVEAARQKLGQPASESSETVRRQREQALRLIQVYRDKRKPEAVAAKLRGYVTTKHTIYPSLGAASFFEFEFRNPYDEDHEFSFRSPDPELVPIKSADEWAAFRKAYGVAG
jgi:hypothetical protein